MYARAFANHFNSNYIVFKYLSKDCYSKVKTALNDLKAIAFKINDFAEFELSSKHKQYVCEMVESNIVMRIYDKLYRNVLEFCLEDETQFFEDADKLIEVQTPAMWGFNQDLYAA